MKKKVIICAIFLSTPMILFAQNQDKFRKKMDFAKIDSAIQKKEYPSAYVTIKSLERKSIDFDAQIAQKKLDVLLHIAAFNNPQNTFYKEILQTIDQLIATYDGDTKESLNVDIEKVQLIQLNYLQQGTLLDKWKNDKNYKAAQYAIKNKDAEVAIERLTLAANEDNALAYFTLGEIYENGNITAIDIDQALAFYESAAELKYNNAYAAVARCMTKESDGSNIEKLSPKEEEEYIHYLQLAINSNSSDAMFVYAKILLLSNDKTKLKQQQVDAYKLMLRAAALENIYAYAELAKMHCKGIGTAISNLEATYWINKLAETKSVSNKIIVELQDCIKDL